MNKDQATIMKLFYEQNEIYCSDFDKYGIDGNSELFNNLYNNLKLLEQGASGVCENIHGFNELCTISVKISDKGKEEYKKYCSSQNAEMREIETLKVAKEANAISKQANDKSDKSNRISLGSLVVAILSAIIAVVAIIVTA